MSFGNKLPHSSRRDLREAPPPATRLSATGVRRHFDGRLPANWTMRRTTSDQQSSFQTDYFLTQLSHFTEAKFSLFEHAPLGERRDRFRNHVEREEMPLTFCKMGINIPVKLEWSQTSGNEISFRSRPFVFNGICVKVAGTMNFETLDGRVRFERAQQIEEEPLGLTDAEIASLRRDGLPI